MPGSSVTFEIIVNAAQNQYRQQQAEPRTRLRPKHQPTWEQRDKVQYNLKVSQLLPPQQSTVNKIMGIGDSQVKPTW